VHFAGRFPKHGKPSCNLQHTFPSTGNLRAICSTLSQARETSVQIAERFPEKIHTSPKALPLGYDIMPLQGVRLCANFINYRQMQQG